MATARPPYVPPDRAAGARYGAFALDLIDLVRRGDSAGIDELLGRLYADPESDPWALALATARVAVKRPCGRAHPPEEG